MSTIDRREAMRLLAMGVAGVTLLRCRTSEQEVVTTGLTSAAEVVESVTPLGPRWPTSDPFLFCAHHDDRYPRANVQLGPDAALDGRRMGQDFSAKDGWSMYHGSVVPGFPKHPHRGFETVTVVRKGLLDHSDSLGARARYGGGDVQWLTAGAGINHAEMFPLLDRERENHVELFQIWLNLPRVDKMAQPRFAMFWNDTVPRHRLVDEAGRVTTVTAVTGTVVGAPTPPPPPPDSWASRPEADVAIWTIALEPGARFVLPRPKGGTDRSLYFFAGRGLSVGGRAIPEYHRVVLARDTEVLLEAAAESSAEVLLLQGRPIAEPVTRHGPFVMNTPEEIRRAYADYRASGFGGWPWSGHDPVHGPQGRRFAEWPDGRIDEPA